MANILFLPRQVDPNLGFIYDGTEIAENKFQIQIVVLPSYVQSAAEITPTF
jgi:hypothetical protein